KKKKPKKAKKRKGDRSPADVWLLTPLKHNWTDRHWHDFAQNERATPFKELLVLDLNGTLLKRAPVSKTRADGQRGRRGYLRPYLHEFLRFALDNFAVMVWSSAQAPSVHDMLAVTFAGMGKELVRVWDRRFCEIDGGYFKKSLAMKDLRKITDGYTLQDSPFRRILNKFDNVGYTGIDAASKGKWSLDNIVLIDDSEEKVLQPDCHLFISTYEDHTKPDSELKKVTEYLRAYAENRTKYGCLVAYMQQCQWSEFKANSNVSSHNSLRSDVVEDPNKI
ncbi:hypothetical protein EC988_004557, partial [Linderina pennispora]